MTREECEALLARSDAEAGMCVPSMALAEVIEALRATLEREAQLQAQLDRTWVCPCCREGADTDLCATGEDSGRRALERAEQRGRNQAIAEIVADLRGAATALRDRPRSVFCITNADVLDRAANRYERCEHIPPTGGEE